MTTITEDYVSFEIAKLLKEKGFDAKCDKCYAYFADDDIRVLNIKYPKLSQLLIEDRYPCVTLQMAMKWLREEYNLFIQVTIVPHTTITMEQKYYFFLIHKDRRRIRWDDIPIVYYNSYEEACEAAIKYCLENLI